MKHKSVDKAKRVDPGCRNHGSCPYCRRSRTRSWAKLGAAYRAGITEWREWIGEHRA